MLLLIHNVIIFSDLFIYLFNLKACAIGNAIMTPLPMRNSFGTLSSVDLHCH